MFKLSLFFISICFLSTAFAQSKQTAKSTQAKKAVLKATPHRPVLPGAYQLKEYLPLLQGKRVAVFANNTSVIGSTHLVDTLQKSGINIVKIFGPEHGFRGNASAGEKIDNYTDPQTGITVISLYGKKQKPAEEDLANVDVLLFDIQDVGVRFYTYISSLQQFMESAMQYNKPLIILDRPNPNGYYVDGPVLDTAYKSFIGMQPVPVVYGMTIGEYANFLIGQGLLDKDIMAMWMMRMINEAKDTAQRNGNGLNITVIKCRNYTHKSTYILPVKPSPNLPDSASISWYPSTCFFEGTVLSEGRGTDHPFLIFGHPALPKTMYAFTPVSNQAAKGPKLENRLCYGWNIANEPIEKSSQATLQLKYLLEAYRLFPDKDSFFIKPKKSDSKPTDFFFNKLAGNALLMQQIKEGKTEKEIRASWEPKLAAFKKIRKKYLMYPDFDER